MGSTPLLTDRDALNRHRARARSMPDRFVHLMARDSIEERLELVNKSFHRPAVIGPFPEIWSDLMPGHTALRDDPVLGLTEASHDIVIHAMALHWADDPVGQLIQCRRALAPDGLFLGVCFGGNSLHELRTVLAETESRLFGGISPRVAPMAEIRDLGGLLQRAGFALPVADSETLTVQYRSIRHLASDLRGMGEQNAMAARSSRPLGKTGLAAAEAIYASHFGDGDDGISATFEMIFLTGWAPSASQPKPLRPGSAQQRLADALGTVEQNAGDAAAPESD